MQNIIKLSDYIIPGAIFFIVLFGCQKKIKVYEVFLQGAKEGIKTVVDILPTLIGLLVAVEIFREGGTLEIITKVLKPIANLVNFPPELVPLGLIKLFSSSAATGLLLDILDNFGPDSFLGRTASVMMSCTETVFYTMSVYFLSAGVHKTRYTLVCALLANFVGLAVAVFLVRASF